MSEYKKTVNNKAVALRYDEKSSAPIVVATGMGHLAEKIVTIASENDIPVYEDNSLATILQRLELGQEIPEDLYKMIVELYVYFLNVTVDENGKIVIRNKKNENNLEAENKENAGG